MVIVRNEGLLKRKLRLRYAIEAVEIQALHHFIQGTVYLWVSQWDEKWLARVGGCEVDCGHLAPTCDEAFRHNENTFHALFPEHRCSERCKQIVAAPRQQK
jgi:hypothetical protein